MTTQRHATVFMCVAGLACSAAPEPSAPAAPSSQPSATVAALSADPAAARYVPTSGPGDAAGFVHVFANSRFHLTSQNARQESSVAKVVGDDGVFATNKVTGASRALRNADSPVLKRPPLTQSADAHNARVLAYFKAAGLPQDQIREAHVLTHMISSGPSSEPHVTPTFAGYATVITRQINGIPVPDSFAAARFNADDEVVEEWVYWPTIPSRAIADASAIATALVGGSGLRSRLPARFRTAPAIAAIRHTDFADESGFQAFGSLDVRYEKDVNGGYRGGTRNFDINGSEVIHPNRRPNTVTVDTPKTF
jgi:hypothetical protein